MITEKELNITNNSYINKDFYQIYPEILELVTKITERWHPESSNESDPGVVLLKLLAFIADKNNYNIDKNVLECFMPSATQQESMRKLCDMMGYEMKYYQSATTKLNFSWSGDERLGESNITLPAFETTVQNKEGDVTYTLIESASFGNAKNDREAKSIQAIEGEMFKLKIGQSEIITLQSIDSKNRIYLPESMIAENGIFIQWADGNKNIKKWEKISNLNTIIPNKDSEQYYYKFGYDSNKQLPYIQFPDNIAEIIGSGLKIWYTRTTGVNGNISANILTKLTSQKEYKLSDDNTISLITDQDEGEVNLYITNAYAAVNGADIETLDQAYSNFKKTVGTFNTLVTCRDYANAIYNMIEGEFSNTPLISNCQVGDIRTDSLRSSSVKTFTPFGDVSIDIPERVGDEDTKVDLINHFDLYIYPLNFIGQTYTAKSYNDSFKFADNKTIEIRNELDDETSFKTISHNILTPYSTAADKDKLFLIKNKYNLAGRIITTYKVSVAEGAEIITHIHEALYRDYNPRNLEYGEPIPFESLFNTIKNSDPRIKNIILEEPILDTVYLTNDNTEITPDNKKIIDTINISLYRQHYLKMLAKNIIAGKVSLFDYNTSFKSSFLNKQIIRTEGEGSATTSTPVPLIVGAGGINGSDTTNQIHHINSTFTLDTNNLSDDPYTLKDNETIKFRAPSLRTAITYPYLVNYSMYFGDQTGPKNIPANTEYQLKKGDILYLNYSDSEGDEGIHWITYYKDGNKYYENDNGSIKEFSGIIKATIDLPQTNSVYSDNVYLYSKKYEDLKSDWQTQPAFSGKAGMLSLEAKDEIQIRDFIKVRFVQNTTPESPDTDVSNIHNFVWITKTGHLFDKPNDTEKTLNDGEYLFYTDEAKSQLFSLGAGTLITTNLKTAYDKYYIDYSKEAEMSIEQVSEKGLGAFSDTAWQTINFNATIEGEPEYLLCREMQYLTLAKGDTINKLNFNDGYILTPIYCNTYRLVRDAVYNGGKSLPGFDIEDYGWEARSSYDLLASPTYAQTLNANDSIMFYNQDGTLLLELKPSNSFTANYPLIAPGGDYIHAIPSQSYTLKQNYCYEIYPFNKDNTTLNNDIISQLYSYDSTTSEFDVPSLVDADPLNKNEFNVLVPDNCIAAIMIYWKKNVEEADLTLKVTDNVAAIQAVDNILEDNLADSISLKDGLNIIFFNQTCSFSFVTTDSNLIKSDSLIMTDCDILNTQDDIDATPNFKNLGVDIKTLSLDEINAASEIKQLLKIIKELATDKDGINRFYYTYKVKDQEAIDIPYGSIDENFWFDSNNVMNNFVLAQINTETLDNLVIARQSIRR